MSAPTEFWIRCRTCDRWWETAGSPDPTAETWTAVRDVRRKRRRRSKPNRRGTSRPQKLSDPWANTPTEAPRPVADGEPAFAPEGDT